MTGERWRTTPWWRLFGAIFAITFGLIAIWSVAVPLLSGPDEQTHTVKAAAVVRGQFVGKCAYAHDPLEICPKSSPFSEVRLPAFYSILRPGGIPKAMVPRPNVSCFSKRINVPANCLIINVPAKYQKLFARAWIYDGRYPPLYYVIAGIPSLFGTGQWAIYLMRLFGAGASALLISAAIFSVLRYSKNRLLLLGIVISATPVVFYLSGVVNSSGLEIASALAFWTMLCVMVRECDGSPPRALVVLSAFAALTFISTRSLSPFWFVLAILSVVAIANWRTVKKILGRRDVQIAMIAIAVVGLADVFWILYEHSTVVDVSSKNAQALIPSRSTSELTILRTSFHHNIYYLPGMIAVFGAFDTYAPHLTFIIWYLLAGVLFLTALIAGDLRRRIVLIVVALGILLLPVIISSSQARHLGYVWSGRDTLPLAVGLPILCASVIGEFGVHRLVRWVAPVVLVLAWIAQGDAFFGALRRYSVGDAGPRLSFLIHSAWSPPVLGCLGAFLAEVVLLAAAYFAVFMALGAREAPLNSPNQIRRPDVGMTRPQKDLVEAE